MSREEARAQALGALYAADVLKHDTVDIDGMSRRAAALAIGTWDHREEIDGLLTAASASWRIERMPTVDRNILRLGAYELRYVEVPHAVVLSEAVELAKQYSTAKSGSFVNGVLAAIAAAVDRHDGGTEGESEIPDA